MISILFLNVRLVGKSFMADIDFVENIMLKKGEGAW